MYYVTVRYSVQFQMFRPGKVYLRFAQIKKDRMLRTLRDIPPMDVMGSKGLDFATVTVFYDICLIIYPVSCLVLTGFVCFRFIVSFVTCFLALKTKNWLKVICYFLKISTPIV